MKIIFLDMDGVLCTIRSHVAAGSPPGYMEALDREAVGLLNRLAVDDTQYVLSSTWRKIHTYEFMVAHLQKHGWTGKFHEEWKTPILDGCRGIEIEDWLDRNKCDAYVILDDDSDMLNHQMPKFVHTHVDDGFSWANFKRANFILHGDEFHFNRQNRARRFNNGIE